MIRRLAVLLGGSLLFWAVASGLIWLLWPQLSLDESGPTRETALGYALTAELLCLVPMLATYLWAVATLKSPDQLLLVGLGGTGLRMAFVLGVGLLLNSLVEYYQYTAFWIVVLVFYLANLALEMSVLLAKRA